MKRLLLLVLLLSIVIPIKVYSETCDSNKIAITSIDIEKKSSNVTENESATQDGNNINVNLNMSTLGDSIKYRINIKNESNEDYLFKNNDIKLDTNYIDYSIEFDDKSNIIKKKSTKLIYLNIQYKNPIPEESFENGNYKDNKEIVVNLSEKNNNLIDINNPNTGKYTIIILLLIILFDAIIFVLLKRKNKTKYIIIVLVATIIIPIGVKALCEYDINISSNVTITKDENTEPLCIQNSDIIDKYYVYNNDTLNIDEKTIKDCSWKSWAQEDTDTGKIEVCLRLSKGEACMEVNKHYGGTQLKLQDFRSVFESKGAICNEFNNGVDDAFECHEEGYDSISSHYAYWVNEGVYAIFLNNDYCGMWYEIEDGKFHCN